MLKLFFLTNISIGNLSSQHPKGATSAANVHGANITSVQVRSRSAGSLLKRRKTYMNTYLWFQYLNSAS